MQTTVVRAMVSQTVGWASVFCAFPGGGKHEWSQGLALLGWGASLSPPPPPGDSPTKRNWLGNIWKRPSLCMAKRMAK